jgi:ABC-type glycerol-3-phosphate transport system substrate-binding protein
MSFREHDRRTFIADAAGDYAARRIGKREFIRRLSLAGVGLSSFTASFLGSRPPGGLLPTVGNPAAAQADQEMIRWLRDVGSKFRGQKIRYTSEATPPTIVASQLAKDEFTANTGIEVEIEIVPLEQVLQKATVESQGRLGTYDLYYLDQSWTALFAPDTLDPRELLARKADLAMPGFDIDDFSKPLVEGISMFRDKMIGLPFDIPIFVMIYRKDLLEKHKIQPPATMDEYLNVVRAIDQAERGNGVFGTTGQLRSGHYSLNCDWTAWLDGPDSKVKGLMEAARPPKEAKLRAPSETGFLEIPHIGHQGGSSLAISRYSRNPDAAWAFMQWVCSKDVVARSSTLGGASPVRSSAFKDPRVLENARVGPGTTRHFPAIEWTINNAMGSEPKFPAWAELSNNTIPVELGRLLAGQHHSPADCMAAIKRVADRAAAPFRGR